MIACLGETIGGAPQDLSLPEDDGVQLPDEVIVSPPFTCGNRRLLTCPPRRAPSHHEFGSQTVAQHRVAQRPSASCACRSARRTSARRSVASGAALKRGVWPVAGCDEAGSGPLAGPVVAAAVILDPKRVPRGLDDSKKLDRGEREKLYARICASAEVAVAFGSPARIDRDNILRASLWALARAVAALPVRPKLVFVDGRDRIEAAAIARR